MCEVGGARWRVLLPVFFVFYRVFVGFYQDISEDREKLTGVYPVFFFERSVVGGVCYRRELEPVRYH